MLFFLSIKLHHKHKYCQIAHYMRVYMAKVGICLFYIYFCHNTFWTRALYIVVNETKRDKVLRWKSH